MVNTEGTYERKTRFNKDIESTEMITYDNRIGDFSFDVMVGHNIVSNYWEKMEFDGSGLVVANIYNSSNVSNYTAGSEWGQFRSWSLFGKASIGYKSMLYYSVTEETTGHRVLKTTTFIQATALALFSAN